MTTLLHPGGKCLPGLIDKWSEAMGYPLDIYAWFVLLTVAVSEGSQISGVHYPK